MRILSKYEDISASDIMNAINEWIRSERDRDILKLRLIDGMTLEKIAEEKDMSVSQIKHIIYKGEQKVFKKLKSDLISLFE